MWNTTGFGMNPSSMSTNWGVALSSSETVVSGGNDIGGSQTVGVGEQHGDEEPEVIQSTESVTNEKEVPEEQQVVSNPVKESDERNGVQKCEVRESTGGQDGPSVGEAVSSVLEVFLREQVKPLMADVRDKKDVTQVVSGVRELKKQVTAMGTEFQAFSGIVREHMATEVADLQCRLSKSESEAVALRSRVSDLEDNLAEVSEKSATRKERIQVLIGQVQQLQIKVDDLESQQVQSVSSESSRGPDKGEGRSSNDVRPERRRRHAEKKSEGGERRERERKRSDEDDRRDRRRHQRRPSRSSTFFGF